MVNKFFILRSSFFILHSSFFILHSSFFILHFPVLHFFPRPAQVQQETTEKGGKLPNKEFPPLHKYNNKVY